MVKLRIVGILLSMIIYNAFALRRSGDLYFKDDSLDIRQPGSMLSDIAHELLRRSSSSSQVLNLNLSNLLLLLVLKAVVYGAGYIGNHAFKGREDAVEDHNVLSEGEATLALGYMMGDSCLYRAACEVPHTANKYLGAATMIFQTINFLPQFIPIDDSYEKTMLEFQKAIDHGLKGQCPLDYSCKKENIHRFLRPQ